MTMRDSETGLNLFSFTASQKLSEILETSLRTSSRLSFLCSTTPTTKLESVSIERLNHSPAKLFDRPKTEITFASLKVL